MKLNKNETITIVGCGDVGLATAADFSTYAIMLRC